MKNLKSFLSHILLKAFMPFLVTLCISSQREEIEKTPLLLNQDQDLANGWFKSTILGLGSSLGNIDLYRNYAQFMVFALIFHTIIKAITKVTERRNLLNKNEKISEEENVLIPERKKLSSLIFKGLIRILIISFKYTLAYCFYLLLGLCLLGFSYGFFQGPQLLASETSKEMTLHSSLSLSYRVLEQQQQQEETSQRILSNEIRPNLTEKQLSSLSLSVGTVLGSLNFDYYSIVLSNDGRFAFASLEGGEKVNIIDISNLQTPRVIAVISLTTSRNYYNRYLKLSTDGKMLFVSNFQYLEILDITNVNAPKILSTTRDPSAQQKDSGIYFLPQVYQMSMAFSGDGKTLFVGGLGLQIFNISNLTNPKLYFSTRPDPTKYNLPITSVSVASDGKTLFYANGTLNIMQTFGSDEPKVLAYYSSKGPIVSALLSPDAKTAYVTLSGIEEKVIIEKLDISDIRNPRKIKEYELRIPKARLFASVFLAATPAFSHLFLSVDMTDWESEIVTFNLLTEEFLDRHNRLVKSADSLVFSTDNRILFTTSQHLFEIIELKFDYPNSRTFSLSENLIFDLKTQGCLTSMGLSAENNLLFTIQGCGGDAAFVIYDIQNISSPERISSSLINAPSSSSNITVSNDNQRVFISTLLALSVWDTSDLSSPKLLKTFTVGVAEGIHEYTISSNGNYVFLFWKKDFDSMALKILNVSDELQEIPCSILSEIPLGARLALSADNKILYALKKDSVEAYDISDILSPKRRFTMNYHDEGQPVTPQSFAVSPDNKILLISLLDSILEKLHIYDISDPSNPQFKSEFTRPKSREPFNYLSTIFSSDLTKIYLMQPNGLMTVNITNLEKPKIASIFPISNDSTTSLFHFLISGDNRIGFIRADGNRIKIISLETPYTVYLNRESFYLGEKYTGNVILFGRPPDQKSYIPCDQAEHRFLKTGILDIRVAQTEKNTKQILSPLPYWMNFDKENSVISIEAKKQLDLGVYSIYAAFSNQVPLAAFDQAEAIKNGSFAIEDVITTLISLGYIDHQRFLTPNFGSYGDFVLPKKSYSSLQRDLYGILKQYLFEVVTVFDILPSLDVVEVGKKLLIKTLSDEPVRADIKLNGGMQFVNKHYASLQPVVTEDKTRMTLEGSQRDMNKALEMLIVNIENVREWGGTIAISDHLNPTVTKTFANISELFKINEKPIQKASIQAQIDAWDIYTGVHFAINLSNETFVDKYNAGLHYHLEMEDLVKTLPTWISFGDDMVLKGTPPEEFFYQEMRFSLLVKNEFKGIEVPFRLKIKLSWTFGFKLLVKNSPYILTLIGLIVYANKIYNIVFKKRYRYPKDFYLKFGQEIPQNGGSEEGIPPIVFVFQEKKESGLILKEMKKIVGSRNNVEFALCFMSESGGRIDKLKVDEKIKEVLISGNITKKLNAYVKGSEVSQKLIHQLIFNQLTFWLLEDGKNEDTRKIFNDVKEEWVHLVDWDLYGMCKINETKFSKILLERKSQQSGDYNLMADVDLLREAIEGYAFMKQSINYRAIEAHIVILEKVEDRNILFEFLKYDLVNVNFSDKGKMGYGMYYKIQNDVLSFSGVPEEKFAGKTMVVQIKNRKHKILNEIWIHGGSLKKKKIIEEVHEDLASGKSYEIY